MFNFLKKKKEQINPQSDADNVNDNLANILGAQENDTNITAGVDAILDDEGEIGDNQTEINSDNFDFSQYNIEPEHVYPQPEEEPKADETAEEYPTPADDAEETVQEKIEQEETEHYPESEDLNAPTEDLQEIFTFDNENETVTDIDALTEETTEISGIDVNYQDTAPEFVSQEAETEPVYDAEPDWNNDDGFIASVPLSKAEESEDILSDVTENSSEDIAADLSFEQTEITADFEPAEDESSTAQNWEEEAPVETFEPDNYSQENEAEMVTDVTEEPSAQVTEITIPAVTANYSATDEVSGEIYKVIPDNELWDMDALDQLSVNPKVINTYTQFETWGGDKYQDELKLEIDKSENLDAWTVLIMNHYQVPLKANLSEVIIDKEQNVVRYASLVGQNGEKLKIFNQSHLKFVLPQDDLFTVQGNVICGKIEDTDVLDVLDYIRIPLKDKVNQVLKFKAPASGLILGPSGTRVYFSAVRALAVSVADVDVEDFVTEYIPSVKDFDNRQTFVYDEQSSETEFYGSEMQNKLVVNVGASLYGWNVHFDNEMFLSLRDALDYQARYKKLPSANGEIIHNNKILKFFNIKTLQAREKTIYYSYGRI